jgi:hypothetical protein
VLGVPDHFQLQKGSILLWLSNGVLEHRGTGAKPRLPNLVSLVSITSGGKPDSKAPCIIGGIVGERPTTQPYLWLDLNERSDPMQDMQPYAGDRGQISARGGEYWRKCNKAVRESNWTGLTACAATSCQGCPERCFNLWRSRGHQTVHRTLHLSW